MKKGRLDLTQGNILKTVIVYTIPIICTSILQLLFNAADLVIVGRFCGSTSVAAVGATGSVSALFVNFFIGLSVGAGVAVAQAYGARDTKTLHRTIHTTILAALISGVILTVAGLFLCEELLILMGTPENILPKSSTYMLIYFGGITFNMLYNFSASILRALGDTKSPLVYLSIAGVVNVVLNVIFVTAFNMDVAGVALATTISQGVSAFLVLRALVTRPDECRLFIRELRVYKAELFRIIRIGLPAGIQSSIFSFSNVIIQSSVNSFGDVFMSGNAAAANIEGFAYVIMNSFMQTAVNFTGQNYGARNLARARRAFCTCLVSVFVVGVAVGSLTYAFAPSLLSIYIVDSPASIDAGIIRMTYICLPYFLCGLMDVTTGAIRGYGMSFVTMIISIIGVVGIRIGWIYSVFAKFHTPEALFSSYIVSWLFTFICQLTAYFIVYNRKKKEIERNDIGIKVV